MDAIEAARQTAEKLHLAASARGSDTSNLLRFVKDEAEHRRIDVFAMPQGDPKLNRGRALFDSQAEMILYEDVGSDFDKAFLIAHEIGHLELEGLSKDNLTQGVEPDRSAEAPAVGAERVVDYGNRERREIIMDLFARELLLPRSLVKRWHIDEQMTSGSIAERLKAPLSVVQQQLIDALLLPPIEPSHAAPAAGAQIGLDESQRAAALHRGSAFQLQAGPGTGKTRTLVYRIESLLEEGVDPGTILVLTFSNKAAGELRERIAAKFPEAVATLWLGTFHSFGLDIVHRFHDRLGMSEHPRVVSRFEAIEMLEDELARLPLKHFRNLYDPTLDLGDMLSAISRAKDEVVNATEYRALAEAMLESAEDEKQREQAEKCLDVAQLYQVYERLLQYTDSVDFGDLVSLPAGLVESDSDVQQLLSSRHQHILVDEYQDVNRASVRLIKAIAGGGKRLWVVGDSRQSIYRFRGASSINMRRFTADFPGAEIAELKINYRSSNEIVDLYRRFSIDMKASEKALPLQLDAKRGRLGKRPEFRVATTADDEIAVIAAAVEEKKRQGIEYKDQAILCTSNNRLSEIAASFETLGLPVLYLGSLFERDEIKDLLSLLSLVTDRRATGLIRAATLPGYTVHLEHLTALQQHLREADLAPFSWGALVDEVPGLDEQACKTLKRLSAMMNNFPPHTNPWSVLASLVIDRLGWAKQAAQAEDLQGQMRGIALWQLLNFARTPVKGSGLPVDRLLSRIRRIVLLSEDREMRQLPQAALSINGVRLMTIHASKGLEFSVVHLPGMIATGLPGSNRPPRCVPPDGLIEGTEGLTGLEAIKAGHDEEEECKFFVATSRAQDSLLMYASSLQNNGKNRSRSTYIGRIAPVIQQQNIPSRLSPTPIEPEILSVSNEELLLSEKQISLYDRCPRRFLYTHALALAGTRTESAFMQMHSAVYEVLGWLGQHHSESTPRADELEAQFMQSWQIRGPVDHGYTDDYRRIGQRLVQYLMETRQGRKLVKPEALQVSFPEGKIIVLPDEVSCDIDGNHSIRCIKTGKKGSDEFDRIEYTLLVEAAERHFGHGTRVEAVHLAGETLEAVTVSDRKRTTRLDKAQSALGSIARGHFPAMPENRTCPRCPSFFICGKVPPGNIRIKN
ncbi:ATP-dependent helicase [Hydrocarboniclastica marina]|uniref:DNA 3'-5' helicase n=1 Tax=Hydrocarboniclastica marina TaxID=2259620 RepID=A0A4P7XGL9_9ALTE|nr:ATP-dependent helicase [Hydrocarboniclastica marina]QCF26126.1 ImmA/IrrE family metallo-endopeptidase [Hydrocarboniclastica marina]